jgi:pimeloyl-ACP methyl ester carboxylesterase
LHPIGHSADVFLRNMDALGRCFTVIAPDLPGHGFSEAINFGQHPPQVASRDHILRLISAMGYERFALAGSSYGGLLASLIALAAPERVDRLCVVGSASTFASGEEQEQALRAVLTNALTAMRSPTLEACRLRMSNICFRAESVAEEILPLQVTYYALPDRLDAFTTTIESLIASAKVTDGMAYNRLGELRMPTLVIVGRDDIRADWRAHERGTARMPNGRFVAFDECGHLPYMEHPHLFNETLLAFLNE